jgi:8-oxo-dGTP pyrophosphatase MutT (NUDIX family)
MTSKKNNTYLSVVEGKYTKKIIDSKNVIKYCGNCGSQYHTYSSCIQPFTSYGLICFRPKKRRTNDTYTSKNNHDNTIYSIRDNITNESSNVQNKIVNEYKVDYEIIMVQRKFTIGYIEFLRGKYQTSNFKYLNKIISLMVEDEKKNILEKRDFDVLREELGMNQKNRLYKNEYDDSKKKFNYLKNKNLLEMLFNVDNEWNETEWGIPKGRRNDRETNLECAIREFLEETGIKEQDLIIYKNVIPLEEVYTGTNNLKYKHIYYLATIRNDEYYMDNLEIDSSNYEQYTEISNIKWFNMKDSINHIRSYYYSKINIIKKAFQIINNLGIYFE